MKNEKTNGTAGAKAPAKARKPARRAVAKAVGASAKAAAKSPDPRSVPAPTAPASVARKAAEAISAVASVATAEPKKAAETTAKPAQAAAPKPVAEPAGALRGGVTSSPEQAVAPLAAALEAGADQARAAYARARETGDTFRQAVADTTTATTRGFVEFNGKVLDLIRAQNDATLDLWRSTLGAGSLSEAIRVQTHGFREAYETTAAQWKDLAETAGRLMGEAARPLRSAFTQGR
ncbi:MAG TPA: phasin family protein [Beijerinckiaceae bacterium]|jgi:hypothetical protein